MPTQAMESRLLGLLAREEGKMWEPGMCRPTTATLALVLITHITYQKEAPMKDTARANKAWLLLSNGLR